MTTVRPPVIAGLAPGSGISTLAAALHASDAGVLGHRTAGEADVVVCRPGALRHAAALACAPSGPRPVLAVLLGPAGADAVGPRPAALRTKFAAVVTLPHVPRWSGCLDVRAEAGAVLGLYSEHLTDPVRAYAAALRALVAALADAGVLRRTAPPLVSRPSTGGAWTGAVAPERALRSWPRQLPAPPLEPVPPFPVSSPAVRAAAPATPGSAKGHPGLAELDDEALEALLLHPPVAAGGAG